MTIQPELEHVFISSTEFTTVEAVTHKTPPNPQTRTEEHKLHAAKSGIFFFQKKIIFSENVLSAANRHTSPGQQETTFLNIIKNCNT